MTYAGRLPVSECSRLVANALNESVTELRKDNEMMMSQYVRTEPPEWHVLTWCCRRITTTFQEELSVLREGEQRRLAEFREGEQKRLAELVFLQVSNRHEPNPFRFRFEKAIAIRKPRKIKTDPTTNFWTVYKEVADGYDTDLVSKYAGDLDTSLVFVSAFMSPTCLTCLNKLFFLHVRQVYSRPLLPRSLSKSPRSSNQTPPI
jgi:hypothetical protein